MKQKFESEIALRVAREICLALADSVARIEIAGSLRRRREMVGDVEILFVPLMGSRVKDLFAMEEYSKADARILEMEQAGTLARRKNSLGAETYGLKNKLMVHVASGIPVDLFTATEENWHNYLVCRTGPAESNIRICAAAQDRGWKWNPYGAGFTKLEVAEGQMEERKMASEREVFEFVGLPYLEPWDRK